MRDTSCFIKTTREFNLLVKIFLLFGFLFTFSCKEEPKITEKPKIIEFKKYQDKLCVWNLEGSTLFESIELNSEKVLIVPYKTLLEVKNFFDREENDGNKSNFAYVQFEDKKGFLNVEDLEWRCEPLKYNKKSSKKINAQDIYGRWKYAKNDRLFIEINTKHQFEGLLTGGCDSGGCLDYPIEGEWKISRNLIYFRPKEFIPKYPDNVKAYYLDKSNILHAVDYAHGFQYDYDNAELLSGLQKFED